MDFTVLIVGHIIGIGIPLRNEAIREHRKKGTKTAIFKCRQRRMIFTWVKQMSSYFYICSFFNDSAGVGRRGVRAAFWAALLGGWTKSAAGINVRIPGETDIR